MSFDMGKYVKSMFLHGNDLEGPTVATIKEVFEHQFADGNTTPALKFFELSEMLTLNKTQVRTMIELFGANPEAYPMQRIVLMPAPSGIPGKKTIIITKAPPAAPTINGQPVVTQPTPPAQAVAPQPTAPAPSMPSPQPAAASDPAALWGNTAAPATPTVTGGGVTFQ